MAKRLPELQLGVEVVDTITDFKGVCVVKAHMRSGNIQYGVIPKVRKGNVLDEFPTAHYIDDGRLKVIGNGVLDNVVSPGAYETYIGREAEAIDSKVSGIIIECVVWMNGCVYYTIQPPASAKKSHEAPKPINCQRDWIKIIGDGVAKMTTIAKQEQAAIPPGGPSRRINFNDYR